MAKERFVELYRWYIYPNGIETVVVNKAGRHIDGIYRTTQVMLLDKGTATPRVAEIKDFFTALDEGKLKELK